MKHHKFIILVAFSLGTAVTYSQSVEKRIHFVKGKRTSEKGYVNVLPIIYDSNATLKLLKTIDTLPKVAYDKFLGMRLKKRMYYLTQPNNPTIPAIALTKTTKFQRLIGVPAYVVIEYNDSGKYKRWMDYDKHYKKTGQSQEFDSNWGHLVYGTYKNDHKVGKWRYYNKTTGIMKIEKYTRDGVLVKTKERHSNWMKPYMYSLGDLGHLEIYPE